MKTARFVVISSVIAAGACGPGESLPPRDAGTSTNDADVICDGVCLDVPPNLWAGPDLVWMGDEAVAPLCPAVALAEVYTGHGYVEGPMPCDACTCGPTSGSCVPPATVTAAASSCADNGPSVAHTSSDPPATWGGLCNGENAIPAGKLCNGVPCVQSVTVAPLTIKQTGCLPNSNTNASPPPWNRFVRACNSRRTQEGCAALNKICRPAAPGPEFKQCISFIGSIERQCPSSYPNKSVFYEDIATKCAPCTCAAPTGSTCTGAIGLFLDGACGDQLDAFTSIDATGPTCMNVPPGSALGSKKAIAMSYQPGSCEPSGGTPEGTVFCCLP